MKSNNQTWVSVCEGDFDQQDAEVVCRQLDCGVPSVFGTGLYGTGWAPMSTQEFQCEGSESDLQDCRTSDSTRNTCLPEKNVGIVCSGKRQNSDWIIFVSILNCLSFSYAIAYALVSRLSYRP